MPLRSYGCAECGKQAPIELRKHGMMEERMGWLRRHYKSRHPDIFAKWYKR